MEMEILQKNSFWKNSRQTGKARNASKESPIENQANTTIEKV